MAQGRSGVNGFLVGIAGGLSTAVALAIRPGGRVLGPVVRFWRLASLRARAQGKVPVTTQFDGSVETGRSLRLEMGEHCRLGRRVYLETCEGGVIRLGANVRINTGSFVVSYTEVSIGRDSLIGEYVSLRDADHGMDTDRPIRLQAHSSSPIRIGEGVWIGRGAVILKGVTIGAGAVVAANSVVTKDVASMAIVAGIPARELRRRGAVVPAAPPPS